MLTRLPACPAADGVSRQDLGLHHPSLMLNIEQGFGRLGCINQLAERYRLLFKSEAVAAAATEGSMHSGSFGGDMSLVELALQRAAEAAGAASVGPCCSGRLTEWPGHAAAVSVLRGDMQGALRLICGRHSAGGACCADGFGKSAAARGFEHGSHNRHCVVVCCHICCH